MKKFNLKGVTKEAVIGISLLILALINSVLQMFGFQVLPISNDQISKIVSTGFLIIVSLYNAYKNRNMTKASQKAQEITDAIKGGEILIEDVDKILNDLKK